ncbi:hypothetical protein PQX77_010385 [Marasmius sp. AFHP31]|nr:hypothetical protein PQX77_010385 [Marasmius sp. AFHP31]
MFEALSGTVERPKLRVGQLKLVLVPYSFTLRVTADPKQFMAKRTPRANNTLYISEADMLAAISLITPFPDLHVVFMTMSAPSNPAMSVPDDARLVSLSSQVPHFDPQ